MLLNNCVSNGQSPNASQSLHIVMNLDNKYSRLQVYNKRLTSLPGDMVGNHEADDENDLADFLSDLPADRVS